MFVTVLTVLINHEHRGSIVIPLWHSWHTPFVVAQTVLISFHRWSSEIAVKQMTDYKIPFATCQPLSPPELYKLWSCRQLTLAAPQALVWTYRRPAPINITSAILSQWKSQEHVWLSVNCSWLKEKVSHLAKRSSAGSRDTSHTACSRMAVPLLFYSATVTLE
jgi:hypothetical protein